MTWSFNIKAKKENLAQEVEEVTKGYTFDEPEATQLAVSKKALLDIAETMTTDGVIVTANGHLDHSQMSVSSYKFPEEIK